MEAESTQSTETYLKILAWLHANQKKLIIAAVAAAVIAAIAFFMAWQKSSTETEANDHLLAVPLAAFHDGELAQTPAAPFLDVAKQFPSTPSGEYAQLLGAQALFTEGKYPEAHQEFSKFIEANPDSELLSQAKVGLAACLEGEGKVSEAMQKYQEILTVYSSDANITSPVKLTLGRLAEKLNKPEQALTYYSDLARINNPYDPWVAEARERGELLLTQHPELRKAPPATAPGPLPGTSGLSPYAPANTKPAPATAPAKAPTPAPATQKP